MRLYLSPTCFLSVLKQRATSSAVLQYCAAHILTKLMPYDFCISIFMDGIYDRIPQLPSYTKVLNQNQYAKKQQLLRWDRRHDNFSDISATCTLLSICLIRF